MKSGWKTANEIILRGVKIAPKKKLEGMRLLNELADRVLTARQKKMRRARRSVAYE